METLKDSGSWSGEGTQGRVKGAVVARPPAETRISLLREIDQQLDQWGK